MEITFSDLRSKEIVNIYDGKRLGRIIDISFERETGRVLGFIVPGIKKVFKRSEDIFIPLELIKKIGEDVVLVKLSPAGEELVNKVKNVQMQKQIKTYVRYKRMPKKEE